MFTFFDSTIGKKIMVAVTGLMLFGFVAGHMLGNLQIFLGPEKFNAYAEFLHNSPGLIWGTRAVLLLVLAIHVIATVQLVRLNRASRPQPYVRHDMMQASWSSRFMIFSGIFLFGYIVYHILHFTTGHAHPDFVKGDVYANVITGFQSVPASLVYIVAMVSLGFHLYHGVWSVFQTLGLNHPKINLARRVVASLATGIIVVGFISIPIAVLMGVLR
jgi:succinate dehydrogenase / fumarate reductase, cytochrome b subunit